MPTSDTDIPPAAFETPNAARAYDYMLGGKNNVAADRALVTNLLTLVPEALDSVRSNRQFMYRAVRFLARDAGIRQFLDLGSGLPSQDNVYEVARRFQPDARVVYTDNEPVVLSHGRAMLATDEHTAVIAADVTRPDQIFAHPRTRELLDFSQPVGVLFLKVGQFIADDEVLRQALALTLRTVPAGSYLAFSEGAAASEATAAELTGLMQRHGLAGRVRLVPELRELVRGWEPVEPGFVDLRYWRPDPQQPPLPNVDEPLRRYLDLPGERRRAFEFGGVARKPGQAQDLRPGAA